MRIPVLLLLLLAALPAAAQEGYVSPYRFQFTFPASALTADFETGPRASAAQESFFPPFPLWAEPRAYPPGHESWGPHPRLYPAPEMPREGNRTRWQQERLLAVGQRYLGYAWQHHHIPDWQPPADWPSTTPDRAKGLDGSTLTAWLFNFGLGVRIDSDVRRQAELPGFRLLQVREPVPPEHETLVKILQPGDLIFLRGHHEFAPGDGIAHVAVWVGDVGRPAGEPLVLDSHAAKVKDSNGQDIPPGVQLRPFRAGSWYHLAFDHALRLVR